MRFSGVLFGDAEAARVARQAGDADPPFFSDLNLDQLFTALTVGRDEYRLAPFFRIKLLDADAVAYRHEAFRDLEIDTVKAAVEAFADAMRTTRSCLAQARTLRHRYQKERWFLDAAMAYHRAVPDLAGALQTTALDATAPGGTVTSRALTRFGNYLADYTGSEAFISLGNDTRRVSALLGAVGYCVTIKGSRVTVSRYEGEADHSAQVAATFAKFSGRAAKDYHGNFRNWPDMDQVEGQILDEVVRLFPGEFTALDEFCQRHAGYLDETIANFDREVQFYLAYLDYTAPLKSAGPLTTEALPFTYPRVSETDKAVSAEAAYDLPLAAKLVSQPAAQRVPVVTNDFHLDGPERIFVVTGPNHGGKTTFARMLGQIHYLASLGLPVPARKARLFLPDQVFTHFEREEDLATHRGKLEDELYRIRDVLRAATGDSLLVMNESFSSTTLNDARFIGERVLERMTDLGLIGVYVTFVDELAEATLATVSMVADVVPDNPAERTFTLTRRPADGLAYAAAIAAKYGLTYRQLKGRQVKEKLPAATACTTGGTL
ncbi:MAG TPA: hypothetical protein VGG75_09565 [Trebonia sp.]|jgi:hypothetical protein